MGGRGGSSHRQTAGRDLRRMTTTSQVVDWIKRQRWFAPNAHVWLNGVDVSAAREIAMAFQQVFQRYPQLIGAFGGIKSFDLGSGVYADCNLATGQIRVSVEHVSGMHARFRVSMHQMSAPTGIQWGRIGHPLSPMRSDMRWMDTSRRNFVQAAARHIGIGIGTLLHCKRRSQINLRLSQRRTGSAGRYRDMELPIRRNGLQNRLPKGCAPVRRAEWP